MQITLDGTFCRIDCQQANHPHMNPIPPFHPSGDGLSKGDQSMKCSSSVPKPSMQPLQRPLVTAKECICTEEVDW